ncbi:hypothetical protein ACFW04_011196 [Cataglyphis niger]
MSEVKNILHKCYFNDFDKLLHIAGEIVEMREAFNHEEEDAGGLISAILKCKAKEELEMESSSQRGGSQKKKVPVAEHVMQARNNEEKSEENESENRVSIANSSQVMEEAEEEEETEISVAQSAGGLDIAKRFDVSISSGRGRVKLTHEDVAKLSIITINNLDNLCFPRSLVVAQIYCERGNLRIGKLHKKWSNIRHPHSLLQCELAIFSLY